MLLPVLSGWELPHSEAAVIIEDGLGRVRGWIQPVGTQLVAGVPGTEHELLGYAESSRLWR